MKTISLGLVADGGAGDWAAGTATTKQRTTSASRYFMDAPGSYNQPVSNWRQTSTCVAIVAMLAVAPAARQKESLDDVLKRAAGYVADFRRQLSGIVAEETYRQEVTQTGRLNTPGMNSRRNLKSDLLLVKPADGDRYVELRDVFEVDGRPVRDRQSRIERLLRDPSAGAETTMAGIIAESARYNLGGITRNINTPLMSLMFLEAANQSRFRFKHVENNTKPVFSNPVDDAANDAPVFRVSTEMWTVEYQERGRSTIIRAPDGSNRPAHGRFWINPATGAVLISELIVDTGGVIATVTVSYQSEPLMGFLVPVEMRESYVRYNERIIGQAEYGKFRPIQ